MKNWKHLIAGAALATAPLAATVPAFAVGNIDLNDQLSNVNDNAGFNDGPLTDTLGSLINVALGLLGIVFLLLTLYAGWLWMTAAGDAKNTEKAKNILVTAVVGLVILLSAYAISSFVIENVTNAVNGA